MCFSLDVLHKDYLCLLELRKKDLTQWKNLLIFVCFSLD